MQSSLFYMRNMDGPAMPDVQSAAAQAATVLHGSAAKCLRAFSALKPAPWGTGERSGAQSVPGSAGSRSLLDWDVPDIPLTLTPTRLGLIVVASLVLYDVGTNGSVLKWTTRALSLCTDKLFDQKASSAFKTSRLPRISIRGAHPHPASAESRNAALPFAQEVARRCDRELYIYQMSRFESDAGHVGTRLPITAKDTYCQYQDDEVQENALVLITDVDYYMDLPGWLARNIRPTLLYTVRLSEPAGSRGEVSWTVERGGAMQPDRVRWLTDGGADGGGYMHALWDYSPDHVIVGSRVNWVVYRVERRPAASDMHMFIMLVPVARGSWLIPCGSWLTRRKLVTRVNDMDYGIVRSRGNLSVCHAGEYASCTLPETTVSRLIALGRTTVEKLSAYHLKGLTREENPDGHIMIDYLRATKEQQVDIKATYVDPPDAVRTYTYYSYGDASTVLRKPPLIAAASPVLHEAFAPAANWQSDAAAAQYRVNHLKTSDPEAGSLEACYFSFESEFIDLLKTALGPVCAVSASRVWEQQDRPTQRQILTRALLGLPEERRIKSFVKREVYGKVNDPRMISTVPGGLKLAYSVYTYAVADAIKAAAQAGAVQWYAFGMTPLAIAERVAAVVNGAAQVAQKDYSRWDGRVSSMLREFEIRLMRSLFDDDDEKECVETLMRQHIHVECVTRHGYKYVNEYGRLSGSPETSLLNTISNAYLDFCAMRKFGLSPVDAWDGLGIYGGDDGLAVVRIPEAVTVASARAYGQKLVVEPARPGQCVTFLARIYGPHVWHGDPTSMCDLRRQLGKFHVTHNGVADTELRMAEKAMSYMLTDPATPILSDICHAIMNAAAHRYDTPEPCSERWWSQYDASVQFPNERQDWMDTVVDAQLPGFNKQLLRRHLSEPHALTELLRFPLCLEPARPVAKAANVVVDDVALEGTDPATMPERFPTRRGKRGGAAQPKSKGKGKGKAKVRRK